MTPPTSSRGDWESPRQTIGTIARRGYKAGALEINRAPKADETDDRNDRPKGLQSRRFGNPFTYRKDDSPSRRRKCREWGVVYVPRPGEAPDPEDGTEENPELPPQEN